jgi:CheY-like chemotaxis protein
MNSDNNRSLDTKLLEPTTHDLPDPSLEALEDPVILVVDDIPTNIQLLANILDTQGYQVCEANNGTQALELVEEVAPDLILLDIEMPGMDGYEVCHRLKAQPNTCEIPIIFLTARTNSDDIVKGFKAGAVDYVLKPFNTEELLARVHTHVSLKRSRDREHKLIEALRESLAHVKELKGLIPICANCKKVRNDEGYWQQVESYISVRSDATFSHGICPDCFEILYPEVAQMRREKHAKDGG